MEERVGWKVVARRGDTYTLAMQGRRDEALPARVWLHEAGYRSYADLSVLNAGDTIPAVGPEYPTGWHVFRELRAALAYRQDLAYFYVNLTPVVVRVRYRRTVATGWQVNPAFGRAVVEVAEELLLEGTFEELTGGEPCA